MASLLVGVALGAIEAAVSPNSPSECVVAAAVPGICTSVAALRMAGQRKRAAIRLHLTRLLLVAFRTCAGDSAWSD